MKQNILYIFFVSFFFNTIISDPFLTIIIPSFNNKEYVVETLDSIRTQTYQNYRIIYIDDCSNDGSFDIVQHYINKHNWHEKVIALQNPTRHRKLRNIYYALHYLCADDDTIVFIDCDDKLAHNRALERVARIMSNDSVWFMYGNDKAFPEKEVIKWGVSRENLCAPTSIDTIKKNSFRETPWIYMHIRAFKAWLYKNVQLRDLLALNVVGFKGKFYPSCDDYANIYPMLEMAGQHIFFNDQLVYLYNAGSPLNGFKIERSLQVNSALEIKKRKKYQPLSHPIYRDHQEPSMSALILTKNNAVHVKTDLKVEDDIVGVLSETISQKDSHWKNALHALHSEYVMIVKQDDIPHISSEMIKTALIDLKKAQAEWIHLCTKDHIPLSLTTQYIKDDLVAYAGWVNQPITNAYAHICKRSAAHQLLQALIEANIVTTDYLGMISIIDGNVPGSHTKK